MTSGLWRTAACAIAGSMCLAAIGNASEVPGAPTGIAERIATEAQRFDVPGIAVATVRDGDVEWIETVGEARDDTPVTRESTFNVASLTKPMFATMVMHLAAEDRFALDAPLARHWVDPDLADDARHRQLTARLALSHQSGLPNWRGKSPLAFIFEPGVRHEYSGEGFEYVRRAVERATDERMPALMTDYVTGRAGMADTYFGWSDAIADTVVTGFLEDGSAMDMSGLSQRQANAAASTFSTIADVARFAAWVARGAELPEPLFREMTQPQAIHSDPAEYFSMGWRITTVGRTPILSHDGRENGLRTLMIVDPSARNGLVILTNSSNGELVTRRIIEAALPRGSALNAQTDRDIWHFITSQSPEMQAGLLGFIARSPSFTAKLLHAVHTTLVLDSGLHSDALETASNALDSVVQAHHDGEISAERMSAHLGLLDEDVSDEAVRLVSAFDRQGAQRWVASLSALAAGDEVVSR